MDKFNNIKIAFFDIDGTLNNSKKEITDETIKAINYLNKKGIEIVLCSGRPNNYLLNIANKISSINFSISCNGASVFNNKNKESIYSSLIKPEYINILWEYCNENKLAIIFNAVNERYANVYVNNYKNDMIIINDIKSLKCIDINQLVINFNHYDEMIKLKEFINSNSNLKIINCSFDYLDKKVYGYHWFDIVNNNVSKGNAIKTLLSHLNLNKENAICFGDSINDIEMFNECIIKVAMGNALDDIKKISDYTTLTNDNNGISYFIYKYF